MKSRVIFTVYIDPKEIYGVDEVFSTVEEQKVDFKAKQLVQWFKALTHNQEQYAKNCGADYKIYKIDDTYRTFLDNLDDIEVFETQYQCIQHYKHYLMKELSNSYDEVLYIDLDVFINTDENIFEKFDLSNGIGIYGYLDDRPHDIENIKEGWLSYVPVTTSVSVKTAAMISLCTNANCTFPNYVFNTAIMLVNKELCDKIDYINQLEHVRESIDELKVNDSWWADYIRNYFSINNETALSYLVHKNKIKWQSIGEEWHYPFNQRNQNEPIPEDVKFIHVINKDFVKVFNAVKWWEAYYL